MSSVNELNKNVHMGSFCFCIGVTTSPLGECSCNGDRRDLGGVCPAPHPRGCETLRLTQHTSAPSLRGPRSPVGLLHEGTARDRTENEEVQSPHEAIDGGLDTPARLGFQAANPSDLSHGDAHGPRARNSQRQTRTAASRPTRPPSTGRFQKALLYPAASEVQSLCDFKHKIWIQ